MRGPNAGELTARIEILALEIQRDADGYGEGREIVQHRCYAKFTEQSGTEVLKAGSEFGEAKVRFLIRHTRKPIDRSMTVRYGGRIYNILYVNHYGDSREWLELWCERQTREGR